MTRHDPIPLERAAAGGERRPRPAKPVDSATVHRLSDLAYERIKADIVACELAPGTAVSEARLAASYGFGKAPIRQALSRLSQERFVTALPRRGYVIAPVTLQCVNDIFDLRLLLEPAAAERAAGNVDVERLRELDAICCAGYTPGDRASERAFLGANKAFHVAVARASGNERLARTLAQLLDEMERLFHLGLALRDRTEEMRHEHKALIGALISGDRAAAQAATIEQIESARKMVVDAIISGSGLRRINITRD
jgi:DNA-binding GntR family transcriptional regulator